MNIRISRELLIAAAGAVVTIIVAAIFGLGFNSPAGITHNAPAAIAAGANTTHGNVTTAPHWTGNGPVVKSTDDDTYMTVFSCAKGLVSQEISIGHIAYPGTNLKLTAQTAYDGGQSGVELTGNIPAGVSLEAIIVHSNGPSDKGTSNDGALLTHAGPRGQLDQNFDTARYVFDGDSGMYSISSVQMCLYDPEHLLP